MAYNPLTTDYPDTDDVVLRFLDESTVVMEDMKDELWRNSAGRTLPKRWVNVGNQQFCIVHPYIPSSYVVPDGKAVYARLHYIRQATKMSTDANTVDDAIPDYYHDAIRYAAVAYLMEKDTDLKSMQLKAEMMKSFEYHMEGGVPPLAVTEVDS